MTDTQLAIVVAILGALVLGLTWWAATVRRRRRDRGEPRALALGIEDERNEASLDDLFNEVVDELDLAPTPQPWPSVTPRRYHVTCQERYLRGERDPHRVCTHCIVGLAQEEAMR